MEWLQLAIVVLTIGSFLWMARSDYRHLDAKIDAIREQTVAIQLEIKDFHSRLEKQDADFKSFLKEQELRRNKIILKED